VRTFAGVVAFSASVLFVPSFVDAAGSPKQTLASVLATARAQQSVHYVAASSSGTVRTRLVCDVGLTEGTQQITFTKGKTTGKVTVLVSAGTAYVRGDSFTLTNYLGFKQAGAAKFGGQWVQIPHGDRSYASIAEAVTLSSTIDELRLSGPLSVLPKATVAGQKVVGIKGKTIATPPAVSIVYVTAQGKPLPVGQIETIGGGLAEMLFSHWNEQVHVAVPANPVAIATTGLE
jgi:hypothetical protein